MHSHVHALLTNRRCVLISIPRVEIALIDSLAARLTDHALKIIDLLVLVRHFFALQAAQNVSIADLVDLLLALGAAVLHLLDPFANTLKAVLMSTRVQYRLTIHLYVLQTYAAGLKLLLWRHLGHRLSVGLNCLAQFSP